MEGSVGALVRDLPDDFRRLDQAMAAAICDAFDEFALLLFRGREISLEEQFAICGLLGTLVDQAGTGTTTFDITNRGTSSVARLGFHADFTNAPPEGLLTGASLYGLVLPDEPTSTVYAHSGLALAAMSENLRARIRGRTAIHCAHGRFDPAARPRHEDDLAADPRSEHPVEFRHPRTGRPFLMVSDTSTECIVGMERGESTQLLDELNEWIQQPQFVYRHDWQLHDLVVWDNLVMQHSRGEIGHMGERTLRRVPFTFPAWFEKCQAFYASPQVLSRHGGRRRM